MDIDSDIDALRPVANEIVSNLDVIGKRVEAELLGAPFTSGAFANQNEEVVRRAMAQVVARGALRVSELHRLKDEPAIARVVARGERGEQRTYYICRGMPPSGTGVLLASQRAPVGRLAALLPGDEIELERVGWLEILENAQLRPTRDRQGWDSAPTVFRTESIGARTASSLRDLLAPAEPDEQDYMAMLEGRAGAPVLEEGVRRAVIRHMGLRDQPVLDRIQDEIFRLPLATRLALLGPPGTGKTTTLIRRLGLKLDIAFLAEDEQRLAERLVQDSGRDHRQNWLMFTPTPLLKQYVKDAFAREDVAASERLMKTWSEFRTDIARHHLGLLRTGEGKSGLILKHAETHLRERPSWQAWFEDFEAWQHSAWRTQLESALEVLDAVDAAAQTIARQARSLLAETSDPLSLGIALAELAPNTRAEMSTLDNAVRDTLRAWSNDQLRRDRGFAIGLADELARVRSEEAAPEDEDGDQDDEVADERPVATTESRELEAMRTYEQVLRTLASARSASRSVPKGSRTGKLLVWLGNRVPDSKALTGLGRRLQVQRALRQLANPGQGLLRDVPRHYREFRRERQQAGRWYAANTPLGYEVDRDELDLLLALLLRRGQGLAGRASVRAQMEQPAWSALRPYRALLRAQILVDEATDFSPLQLAAMAALVHPESHSFFASGDFNQRLTSWGTRSEAELAWAVPAISVRHIEVPYRQSRKLTELARRILEVTGQSPLGAAEGDDGRGQHEGYTPVLGEELGTDSALADWLAGRVLEVEKNVQPGTSIAVLAPGEEQVVPIADALRSRLAGVNLDVQACRDGQTVGAGHAVRVFDVEHIKGLEFEAVFLVGLDVLLARHPDLFDKYLYVGATRAASCLGLACAGRLPTTLDALRPLFASDWASA